MKRVLAILAWGFTITAVHAASFHCNQAQSTVDKLICSSPRLSALDERLSLAYSDAQRGASAEQRQQLVVAQRRWLNNVRGKCNDESCLVNAYATWIANLAPASRQQPGDTPFVRTDILANHPAPIGNGFATILPSIDDDLVYSHDDDNGNTKSIVQFDFTNGHWANLVSGKPDPVLIAQDARYIIFHTPHSASFPIEVVNRKTGVVLARTRLTKSVFDAFIQSDRLVLVQGPTDGYSFQQSVAVLELPSLRLIQQTTLPGARLVGIRGNYIYTAFSANAKDDLIVFNRQFKELGRIQIPPPLEKIKTGCQPVIEQNENDRAVLIANCGEIHVVDLKSFSVVHSIRLHALSYSLAIHDGLLFTTANDQSAGDHNGIVVFDMSTGKEVARLPISASTIVIKGNILLAAGTPAFAGGAANWKMETYQIDTEAIRNGRWQEANVVQQCRQAAVQLADTKDLYGAISLCKQAGVEGYAHAKPIPATMLPTLRQYGLWLSQTLDKCPEAVRILEKVEAAKPEPELAHALNEARLKAKVVSGEADNKLSDAERQTEFGQILDNGRQLAKATTKTIEFGHFSNLFFFSGDRLYVGRNGCRTTRCDGGATIGVFDRSTLDELASIQIAPNDNDYQDAITSLAADDRHLYASVEYRYEQEGRPHFFVVDRKTLKVTKRAQIKSTGTLRVEQNRLMTCGCHFTEHQTCAELDPLTLKLTEVPNKICVPNEQNREAIVAAGEDMASSTEFLAVTRDYLVTRNRSGSGAGYVFYPRSGGQPMPPVNGLGDALDSPVSVDGNDIVIRQVSPGGDLIKRVSVPSGTVQTLLGLPDSSAAILHGRTLYVGYGRDLLIYDLKDRRLRRYIKNFITAGFRNNGFGLDMNRIERLIIDHGKLIVLTFYGANSRIIQLSDL